MKNPAAMEAKHVNEWFIKPKHQIPESKQHIHLTPWDLVFLTVPYNQKGLIYTKPQQDHNFSSSKLIETLKDSLSHTLVHFYPLAGQLVSRTDPNRNQTRVYIDSNKGPGARFIHATLEMSVSDIITPTRVPLVVQSLFDHDINDWRVLNYDGHTRPLLSVQVTELVDGVFIGCSMNHVVGDGTSLWQFWNAWSEIHRGSTENVMKVDHHRWFPTGCTPPLALPFTNPHQFISLHRYEPPGELIDGIFHISSESMSKLKAKANEEIKTSKMSSFQALAALIWRAIVRAKRIKPEEVTKCSLGANNRNRLEPPLPSQYFGNSVQSIETSLTTNKLLENSLGWVARLLHLSVANHTDQVVRDSVNNWFEAPSYKKNSKLVDSNTIKIASSPRFNVYGSGFKWLGTPVAIRGGYANRFDGKVYTHPGSEGEGSVGLEICLMPDSMAALESDPEFMDFVS